MSEKDPFDLDLDDPDEEEAEEVEAAPQVDPKEVEELRTFRQEREAADRLAAVAEAFENAGLSPKVARLFVTLNPDAEATPEAVKAFQKEFDIPATKPTAGFTPTTIKGEREHVKKTYSRAELGEIARNNPDRARALAEAGKVKWNNPQIRENRQR